MTKTKNLPGLNFLDPENILQQMGTVTGQNVADFGCGGGYFSIPFAQEVGKEGKIYSLDILNTALESVESRAKLAGLLNVITKKVNLEKKNGSGLATEVIDLVILKDVLFQNENKSNILREAWRVLKNGGHALIIEWNEHESPIGPELKARVKQVELEKIIKETGFKIEKPIEVGNYHYAFLLVK